MQLQTHGLRHGLTFLNQRLKQLTGRFESSCGAMMQARQRSYGICGRIEDELRPLRAPCVFQRDRVHSASRDEAGQLVDAIHRRVRWLEGADPGVPLDVEANVARLRDVARGESC